MDIFAHGLWVGVGAGLAIQRWPLDGRINRHTNRRTNQRTVALSIAMAVLPDLVQLLPILAWALFAVDGFAALAAYATALPGYEPTLPATIGLLAHHLHCVMHSAIVASVVTVVLWVWLRKLWIPLLGWWSHILIDVFTHSADFYPSPVLYPFTERGFDGLAWNTPWFFVLNYAALLGCFGWLAWKHWASRNY